MKFVNVRIHRGSNEIGGTCIELSCDRPGQENCCGTTILVDLGLPLSKEKLTDANGCWNSKIPRHPDAVLISHPHQDHFGLIDSVDPDVPVYIGKLAKSLIDSTRMLLGKELHTNTFKHFNNCEPFQIGDFTITPYLVDHSAVDAYAFLIEFCGIRVFYSGDFRAHGRKSILFNKMVNVPPKNIDMLFMEGTMIEHSNDDFPSESDVENKIYETIKDQKNLSFIISSSQNIDRVVSAFRACKRAGKTLIIDIYTAWVLEKLKQVSDHVPAMDWDLVKVYADHPHDEMLKKNPDFFGKFRKELYKYRIMKEEIEADPSCFLFFGRMSRFPVIDKYKRPRPVNVIYSQWLGYLQFKNHEYLGAEAIAAYRNDQQVNFVYAHTSGHATLNDLKTFAAALNARHLIPIHTEHKEEYPMHFKNVTVLEDQKDYMLTDEGALLEMVGDVYYLKRMAAIRDKVNLNWIRNHLKENEAIFHETIDILYQLDWLGVAYPNQLTDEYASEAATIVLRLSEWNAVTDLEKIVAEEFASWFYIYDAEGNVIDFGNPFYKVAARMIWNAWQKIKSEPPEIFSDKVELPPRKKPMVILVE